MAERVKAEPWVLWKGGDHFVCTRCGHEIHINGLLPAPIGFVAMVIKGFDKEHKKCKPRPKESAPEYIPHCHICAKLYPGACSDP